MVEGSRSKRFYIAKAVFVNVTLSRFGNGERGVPVDNAVQRADAYRLDLHILPSTKQSWGLNILRVPVRKKKSLLTKSEGWRKI
jgi:hypothetical protein